MNYERRVSLQFLYFCFFRRSFAHPKKALSGLKQPGHLRARAVFCMPPCFSPRGIIRPLRLFNIHPDSGVMDRRILYIHIKALRPIVIGRQRDQYPPGPCIPPLRPVQTPEPFNVLFLEFLYRKRGVSSPCKLRPGDRLTNWTLFAFSTLQRLFRNKLMILEVQNRTLRR